MKKLQIIFCPSEVLSLKSPELKGGKFARAQITPCIFINHSEKFHWIFGFLFSPTIKHTMHFIFFLILQN